MEAEIFEIPGCRLCCACAKGYYVCPTTAPSTTSVLIDKAKSQIEFTLLCAPPIVGLQHSFELVNLGVSSLVGFLLVQTNADREPV